jgi:ParB/RepB/Spo0J family partition protein
MMNVWTASILRYCMFVKNKKPGFVLLIGCPGFQLNGQYQIVKGEHRFIAATELGFPELPCAVQEMSDEEALIQLIIGNIQTENHPLEIGLNALQVVQKDSKKGLSAAAYGKRIGITRAQTVSEKIRAARVFDYILKIKIKHLMTGQLTTGRQLLSDTDFYEEALKHTLQDETKHLELAKLPQSDWCWLHDFILKHECSKQQVIAIVKAIKSFRDAVPDERWYDRLLHDVDVTTFATEALTETKGELQQLLTFLTHLQATTGRSTNVIRCTPFVLLVRCAMFTGSPSHPHGWRS